MKPSHKWFDDLVDDTRATLTTWVSRYAKSHEDAQEITQEAYLRVFAALHDKNLEDHTPVALLYTTAKNIALSRIRHNQVIAKTALAVTVSEELRTASRSTEHEADNRQKMQQLLVAVNKLPPKCRSVFMLRMMDGLSQVAIAEELGISVSTVEKHLSRGLKLCRAEIQQASGGSEKVSSSENDQAVAAPIRRTGS